MQSFFHALNIGTLATWLSVAGMGVAGWLLPESFGLPAIGKDSKEPYAKLVAVELTGDLTSGENPQLSEDSAAGGAEDSMVPPAPSAGDVADFPVPPELPEGAEFSPLPDVPSLPVPSTMPAARSAPRATASTRRSGTAGTPQAKPGGRGKPGHGGANGGSGMSDAKRLAGGRMPPPTYPAAARAKGQTGTVVVEFVVGADGRVVSAHASSPCPWPLLNSAAVSAVRRWRFPQGSTSKYRRPIVFRLK